jgi:hypothetical protein|tara:strand:+ start:481 stop:591 length:111 start_codon:yes stop_codon:yes gene_type:complete
MCFLDRAWFRLRFVVRQHPDVQQQQQQQGGVVVVSQ